jgi:subtilisin family serine protease
VPWHLDRIDQRDTNYDGFFSYFGNGTGFTGYTIDTGGQPSHDEFVPLGRLDAVANTLDGSGPLDCNGHGSHVAGLLGGLYVGVAKGAYIRTIKALDCSGSGTTSSVVAAIWFVDDDAINGRPGDSNSPFVVSMSLAGPMSTSMTDAIQSLLAAHHVIVVVAAGNAGGSSCNTAPAGIPGVVAVEASDSLDQRASFSNFGTCVATCSPGVLITSSWLGNAYAVASGTSMSTPIVAGALLTIIGQVMDSGYQLGNQNIRPFILSIYYAQATHVNSLDKPLTFTSFDASSANNFGLPVATPTHASTHAPATPGVSDPYQLPTPPPPPITIHAPARIQTGRGIRMTANTALLLGATYLMGA